MADPIVDNAQLAIRFFGLLPGAYETALELFQSGKADQMERALEIISLNAMGQAGPCLLAYLEQAEREDLMIGVVRCLGVLQHQPSREALGGLLRFGQSPRLTRALAEGLIALDTLAAARILAPEGHGAAQSGYPGPGRGRDQPRCGRASSAA